MSVHDTTQYTQYDCFLIGILPISNNQVISYVLCYTYVWTSKYFIRTVYVKRIMLKLKSRFK